MNRKSSSYDVSRHAWRTQTRAFSCCLTFSKTQARCKMTWMYSCSLQAFFSWTMRTSRSLFHCSNFSKYADRSSRSGRYDKASSRQSGSRSSVGSSTIPLSSRDKTRQRRRSWAWLEGSSRRAKSSRLKSGRLLGGRAHQSRRAMAPSPMAHNTSWA